MINVFSTIRIIIILLIVSIFYNCNRSIDISKVEITFNNEEEIKGDELVEEQKLIYKFKQIFLVLLGNCVQKYGTKLENHQVLT